jgi:hypothetical protein
MAKRGNLKHLGAGCYSDLTTSAVASAAATPFAAVPVLVLVKRGAGTEVPSVERKWRRFIKEDLVSFRCGRWDKCVALSARMGWGIRGCWGEFGTVFRDGPEVG